MISSGSFTIFLSFTSEAYNAVFMFSFKIRFTRYSFLFFSLFISFTFLIISFFIFPDNNRLTQIFSRFCFFCLTAKQFYSFGGNFLPKTTSESISHCFQSELWKENAEEALQGKRVTIVVFVIFSPSSHFCDRFISCLRFSLTLSDLF